MLHQGNERKMIQKEDSDAEAEREADVDRLYKKLSFERHEKLKKDMRDLVTRFRMRAQKYEEKVVKPCKY